MGNITYCKDENEKKRNLQAEKNYFKFWVSE